MPNEEAQKKIEGQVARLQANIWSVPPYDIIKHLMTNPIMGPGGQVNTSSIKDAAAVSLGLLGTGASMPVMSNAAGAFRPSVKRTTVNTARESPFTDNMLHTIKGLQAKHGDTYGAPKLIASDFRKAHPEFKPETDTPIYNLLTRDEQTGTINKRLEKSAVPASGDFKWTPEAMNHLVGLNQNFPKGAMGRDRVIEEAFKQQYPNYTGTSAHLRKKMNGYENESGGSTTLGSNFGNFGERPPGGPPKPRLNTDAPGLINLPKTVDEKWVEKWAKEAGVPITYDKRGDTNYLKLESNISNKPVEVRVPGDEHWGRPLKHTEAGRRFDTGTQVGQSWGDKIPPDLTERYAPGLINQSGGSYAHPEHLEKALELATGASRTPFGPGGFKLVSPDYAPYKLPRGEPTPPNLNSKDQLKLLSSGGGYTTQDIINLLKQKNPNGIVNPQET